MSNPFLDFFWFLFSIFWNFFLFSSSKNILFFHSFISPLC
jgi:hypothetical protein